MTMGQLIESLIGKVAALDGHDADGTPFNDYDLDYVEKRLEQLGYDSKGYEEMYNGMTGEKLKVKIFIGPTYYMRLKHLVEDKLHCLTLDHEVLTQNGWKFHKDITLNDKIATLKDGNLVYENPTAIHYYPDFNGKLYKIETDFIDLQVTDNHRMWVNTGNGFEFKYANEIFGKNVTYKTGTNGTEQFSMYTCMEKAIKHEYDTMKEADKKAIEIFHESGMSPLVIHENDKYVVRNYNRPQFSVNINDEISNKIEKMIDYEGPVFCVSVPSEIFYVRRNGKPVWTGNSRARGPVTLLTRRRLPQ